MEVEGREVSTQLFTTFQEIFYQPGTHFFSFEGYGGHWGEDTTWYQERCVGNVAVDNVPRSWERGYYMSVARWLGR